LDKGIRRHLQANENKFSKAAFEIFTGHNLSSQQKARLQQLATLYPEQRQLCQDELEGRLVQQKAEEEQLRMEALMEKLNRKQIRMEDGRIITQLELYQARIARGWKISFHTRGATKRYTLDSPDGRLFCDIKKKVADLLRSYIEEQNNVSANDESNHLCQKMCLR
jgi:hypothetical protein